MNRMWLRPTLSEAGTPMIEVWDGNVFICGIYAHKNAIHICSKFLKNFKEVTNKPNLKSVNDKKIRQLLITFEGVEK